MCRVDKAYRLSLPVASWTSNHRFGLLPLCLVVPSWVADEIVVDLVLAVRRAGVLQRFIREFFDQNPLSHLGVVAMRNGTAQRLTELSASPVRAYPSLSTHRATWGLPNDRDLRARSN